MVHTLLLAILVALPFLSSAFVGPAARLPTMTQDIHQRYTSRKNAATTLTQMALAGSSSRRDVMNFLGLAHFSAAGLSLAAKPEQAAAKLLPQEETLVSICLFLLFVAGCAPHCCFMRKSKAPMSVPWRLH